MLTIDLSFNNATKSMLRPVEEPLGKTLARMRMINTAPRSKGSKKVTAAELLADAPPAMLLDEEGQPIGEDVPNSEAWAHAATLVIGETKIRIKYNLPTVTGVTPPSVVYAGLPAVCTGIKIIFSRQTELLSEWYVGDAQGKVEANAVPFATNTLVVTPKAEWVGKPLVFRCRANTEDSAWTEVSTPPVVLNAEGFLPMPRWQKLQPKAAPDELRVVSYNVLHESYAMAKDSLAKLYPFCTKEVLSILYRRSRIVQELQVYDADIMCLQEVGREVHDRYYNEVFSHIGYRSLLAVKTGSTKEGCCIAYRKSRFEAVGSPVVIPLSWGSLSRRHPEMAAEIQADHPHLVHGLRKVPSVAIFIALKDLMTGRTVVVSNTHLYYHPDGCHMRAIQFYMLTSAMAEFIKTLPDGTAEIISAGDFNFTRITGGYRLATRGCATPDDDCWVKGLKHYYGMKKQDQTDAVLPQSEGDEDDDVDPQELEAAAVEHATYVSRLQTPPTTAFQPHLTLPFALQDSHPTDEHMKYSHYALGFKACIDHIFVSSGLRVLRTLPPPSVEELSKDVAIPSLMFPSDHVALVADFALTPSSQQPPTATRQDE